MDENMHITEIKFNNYSQQPKYYVLTEQSGYASAEYHYPLLETKEAIIITNLPNV